jgi:transposase-like protein
VLRERTVRMVAEVRGQHKTEWAAMRAVAELLGVGTTETVRKWVRQAQIDAGSRPGVSTEESAELKRLKRENQNSSAPMLSRAGWAIWQCDQGGCVVDGVRDGGDAVGAELPV